MPEAQDRPLRVFLCHSSNDKPTVRELYRQLDAEGWIDAWVDVEKLYPGQDWNYEIEVAVQAADVIIVCLSNNSVTKEGYVQRELRMVLDLAEYKPEGTLFIIPVRLEECEPPRRLRRWQYADYFPKNDRDWAYGRLLISLRNRAKALGIVTEKAEPKPAPAKPSPERPFGDIAFAEVLAGKFLMGSSDKDQQAYGDEKPQHTVDIPYDYYMARFPTTNEQYSEYVQAKGTKHPASDWKKKSDHPVIRVSWMEVMTYCQWLNRMLTSKLPSGLVLRLPTEAEWEKAARGANSLIYPWGDSFDKNKCNTVEGGKDDTTPAGLYSPQGDSPYGCADMAGNVWEWTHSLFRDYPYEPNDGREDESASGIRVLRGGSFFVNHQNVRTAYRSNSRPLNRNSLLGFRVVVAPPIP